MFIRAVLGAAALFLSVPGVSSGLPKQPTGNWIVNFDDAQCVAQRNYRTQQDPLYLVLKQPPVGDAMQFSIVETRSGVRQASEVGGTIEFAGQPPHKVRVLRFGSVKLKTRVLMTNLPVEQFSTARGASALRFRADGFDTVFALTDVEPLLKVMNDCVADLRQVWNVAESKRDENAVRDDVKGDLAGLFRYQDYPTQALRRDESGTVAIALLVDETGKVADCSVIETSGVAVLDAQSCLVVKERAKFSPTVGEDGKPRKGAFVQRISWKLM